MDRLRFGTAGIPLSTEKSSTENGILKVRDLGLDAMELEFVRGVNLDKEKAVKVGNIAEKKDVVLTAHAPYYINLNAKEKSKIHASINRILESAKILNLARGFSVVFHPAYYMDVDKKEAYKNVKSALELLIEKIKDEAYDVWIRPETMGKTTQFGSLEEIIMLSKDLDGLVMPCIDIAHIHARENGKLKTYDDFDKVFSYIEEELGKESLHNMHIHFSGIEYSEKGEKKHLIFKESDFNYIAFAEILKNYDIRGVAISESPNIEEDAILLKKIYEEI